MTTPPNCSVVECDRHVKAIGMCEKHYRRFRRNGHLDPIRHKPTAEDITRQRAAAQARYKARLAAEATQDSLPFGPLADWIRVSYEREPSIRNVAALCLVSTNKAHTWQRSGWLTVDDADRAAIRLGYHPVEIWPVEWMDVA